MLNPLDDYTPAELGKRLRTSREAAGVTQAAAASCIDVARTTIVAVEKGERRIQLGELRALCRLYSTSINSLLRPEAPQIEFEVQFRKHPDCKPGPIEDATKLLADLTRAELELESVLGIRRSRQDPPERPVMRGDVMAQAESDAQDIRQWLGIGNGPIQDILSLIEFSLGARIFVRKLDSKLSAAFAYSSDSGPCFLLNANHPKTRQAQSMAHELGHFVSNRKSPKILLNNAPFVSREERYADAFGRAFLTPARQTMQKFHDITAGSSKLTRRHVILLSHYFGISREALVRRLEELKLVRNGTWNWFDAEGGINHSHVSQVMGERIADVDRMNESYESTELRLQQLASQTYQQKLMSEGQLSRLLRIDRLEIRAILDNIELDGEGGACDILS